MKDEELDRESYIRRGFFYFSFFFFSFFFFNLKLPIIHFSYFVIQSTIKTFGKKL